jgi:hypothetical protein
MPSRQPSDHLGVVRGAGLGAGSRPARSPQAGERVLERLGCCEAANLDPGGSGRYGERGKASVHADKSSMVIGVAG